MKQRLLCGMRAFAVTSTAAALAACGADSGPSETPLDEGGDDAVFAAEPVADEEQAIIPGASVTQVFRTFQLPAGGTLVNATAVCPNGSVIVGGGHTAHPQTRVYRSVKAGNGWAISIINLTNATSSTVNVVAQCLHGTNATSALFSVSRSVRAGATACSRPTCPTGTILAGGGFMASTSLQVYRNRPVDDGSGWQLCGKNLNNFDATSFTTVVVCLSGVSGGATWRSAGNKLIEPGESIRLDATCPAGGLLLSSGGFAALEPEIYAYSNNRSFQEPNVWTSTFLNPTDDDGVIDLTINCLELWP